MHLFSFLHLFFFLFLGGGVIVSMIYMMSEDIEKKTENFGGDQILILARGKIQNTQTQIQNTKYTNKTHKYKYKIHSRAELWRPNPYSLCSKIIRSSERRRNRFSQSFDIWTQSSIQSCFHTFIQSCTISDF